MTTEESLKSLTHQSIISEKVTNALAVTSTSEGLTCSFAGGCLYKVTAPGLASAMKSNPEKNYIQVCGNNCTYSDADSTATEAQCKLPAIPTSKSIADFKIKKS